MAPLRFKSSVVLLGAALALAGCSSMKTVIEGDKVEYKSAGRLPPLEIPPDLTRPTADDRYAVPDINPKGQATFSAYSKERAAAPDPSKSGVLPSQENARIERSGSQRWLVVKGEPDVVWNVVKEFWQETGFIINSENPDAGVMETDWAENRAKIPQDGIRGVLGKVLDSVYSSSERDKFRTRLERSTEPGMTEIYVSHRGMEEVYLASTPDNTQTKWQPRPSDPDLEAEMLRRLMARFGVQQERAKVEAAVAQAPARATLIKDQDGSGKLSVNDQFDRAWRRVGLALDRVGFTVEDRDRSKGLYFVRYVDPDADNKTAQSKGFFSKFDVFSSSSKKPAAEQFRIEVKDAESVSQVSVLNKDGSQEKSATANRILSLLYEQLK